MTEKLRLTLDYEQLTNCMRCGFCLPACPTFRETGVEVESPRGRIALMKAVVDGVIEPDRLFEEQMNHCLGCRACEPACPADVKYGQLIEQARDAIEDHTKSHRWWVKAIHRTAFRSIFPKQSRMKLLGNVMGIYQKSGIPKMARTSGVMKLFPAYIREMEAILPKAAIRGVIEQMGVLHPAKGNKIATVALFRGCIMDVLFTKTNVRTVQLLNEAGFEVIIPESQNCCGALHAHSGESEEARALARRNIRCFKEAGIDYIVTNAGGCGALLVEYDHLLHDDPQWREDAAWFAERVIDISEILVLHGRQLRYADQGEMTSVRVTYQDSCHLRNVMRASKAPRELIRQVENTVFTEMKEADRCCGSAGIYNLTQPAMAGQILEHKMEHANATESEFILTSNPGCLLQMKLGIAKHGDYRKTQSVHVVDFLYERLLPG
ncbi:(Fe-S)-binding protein [Paenibacillus sp. BK033]|uniref:(Fe-S)-binding protein n=1 Tax=Paenibacillus sp. BK033 TaxID=2512133 RepID=UPI0010469705|nr:(Fe-S)-binding protein [Paenibacillus sp. BK033]